MLYTSKQKSPTYCMYTIYLIWPMHVQTKRVRRADDKSERFQIGHVLRCKRCIVWLVCMHVIYLYIVYSIFRYISIMEKKTYLAKVATLTQRTEKLKKLHVDAPQSRRASHFGTSATLHTFMFNITTTQRADESDNNILHAGAKSLAGWLAGVCCCRVVWFCCERRRTVHTCFVFRMQHIKSMRVCVHNTQCTARYSKHTSAPCYNNTHQLTESAWIPRIRWSRIPEYCTFFDILVF